MEAKKTIKYFLLCGAAYFTAIGGAILAVLSIITSENANIGIEPSKFLLVLALSYMWALGSTVKRALNSKIAGWIVNAICYIGGFFAFLLLFDTNFTPALIATLFFTVIYVAIALCKSLTRRNNGTAALSDKKADNTITSKAPRRTKVKKDEKKPYENMFS